MNINRPNHDKPHRCPVCWKIPNGFWDLAKHANWRYRKTRFFAIYECPEGHRFTRLPIPGRKRSGFGDDMDWRDELERIKKWIQRKLGRRW